MLERRSTAAPAMTITWGVVVTPEAVGLVAGAAFLLIAVVGGGITVRELQIPVVPARARAGSAVLGVVFIGLSIYFFLTSDTGSHECRKPRELPSMATGDRWEAEVKEELEAKGFRNVTTKPDFSTGAPKDLVVAQEPDAGEILCPSDPVTITVAK